MKKLMKTVAAAAVALVASSSFASLPSPTDPVGFDALTAGTKYTVSEFVERTDAGETSGSRYWYAITNASQEASAELATINNDSAQGNYLTIEAQAPLYRTINASGDFGPELSADAEEIPASGIYLDTMVKFSVSSDEFKDGDLDTADKLAITCYSADDSGVTNIIVRAGYVDGSSITPTNYEMGLPANFDVDVWHRLTVRAIADVGSSTAPVGFAVYLDRTLLTYGTDVAAGDSAYVAALDGAVTQNLYNSETHALLPSLVTTGDYKNTLTAVGFKGTGSLDDIQFTNVKPDFIEVVATFTADAGVTAISVQVGEDDPIAVDMNTLTASLPAGTTEFTVTATIDSTYKFARMTYGNGVFTTNPATITGYAGGEIAITTTRSNFNLFDANNVAISGTFETLADAMAATGVAKIQLAYNYTETTIPSEGPVYTIADGTTLVLDLNGKTLGGGTSDENELFYVQGALTVIDSGNGGKIVYGGEYGIFAVEGDLAIGSEDDNGPFIDGKLFADGSGDLIRAYVKVDGNTTDNKLTWTVAPGSACSAEPVNGYWVVAPSAQPEPTKIDVPTAASNLVYDGEEQTGVAAGEGYTLSGDFKATNAGEYTATATLEDGYIWSDDTTGDKVINWSIAKAQVTATVSLTVTEATYDSGKTSVTDYTTPSVNFGPDAPVLVENTDYTVAWSTTEVTGAGTFTYTVSPVAGGNCTFTETSATLTITAGGEYPTYIDPSDTETKAKYDTWKETYGADTGSAYEEAFLLNCAPANVETAKANFKATITVNADGTVTVTAPGDYNVTPTIQGKQTLSNTEEWHPKAEGDKFFRAVLEL